VDLDSKLTSNVSRVGLVLGLLVRITCWDCAWKTR